MAACRIAEAAIRRDDCSLSFIRGAGGSGRKTSRAARRYRFCPTLPPRHPISRRTQHPTSSALLSCLPNTSDRNYALTTCCHSSKYCCLT
ncbi:unnamed protein product [Arctia plantaginis]|uniref:Uncharacterized protein n=1 Tax=Arctia plantaginis TaxID=874455 RepID=A0A8S0Z6N8_ARCPL|nr:unnamed protein product [Arctia plantaginis]